MVIPGSGPGEMTLEHLAQPGKAVRAVDRYQEALDLPRPARGAAVLLPVEYARLSTHHHVQGSAGHGVRIKAHVPRSRHGSSLQRGRYWLNCLLAHSFSFYGSTCY